MKQTGEKSTICANQIAETWTKKEQECFAPVSRQRPLVLRAKGIELVDTEGNIFEDFTGGAHVCNVGYSHPEIIKATKKQLNELDFVPRWVGMHHTRIRLAERLREIACGSLKKGKIAYCNSGSEATDLSIKLARYSTKRHALLTCLGGFYGGTMGALSLTVDNADTRRHYSPFLPGVIPIPYANCYRCHFGQEYPGCDLLCVKYIEHLLDNVVSPEEIAAVFVEPIQNHGGVIIPPVEYIRKLAEMCSKHGILLVDDEVVTAFGRTGKMLGIEHFAVEPDVMYFGKPIAVGLPLGAVLGRRDLMENWYGGGSTLAAGPLACVRALAMIDIIQREKLVDNSIRVGEHIIRRLRDMAEVYPLMGDVRGKGLMIGIELVKDSVTKEPAQEEAKRVIDDAYKRGLLFTICGPYMNVVKFCPPLIITEEQADLGLDIFESSMKEITLSPK